MKLIPVILAALALTGCYSAARQYDLNDAQDPQKAATIADHLARYVPAGTAPTLAQRFAQRPKLKVAVVSTTITLQGEADRNRDWAIAPTTAGNWTTTHRTYKHVKGLAIPPPVGIAIAGLYRTALEVALDEHGFDRVPFEKIAATAAYRQANQNQPPYDVHDGKTTFAAPGMKPSAPSTESLLALRQALGQDVLFLRAIGTITHHDVVSPTVRKGHFAPTGLVAVFDPEHPLAIDTMHAHFRPTPRPRFLEPFQGDWLVRWGDFASDAERAYVLMGNAFADTLNETAFPKAQAE